MSNISKSVYSLQSAEIQEKGEGSNGDKKSTTTSMFDVAAIKRKQGKRKVAELPKHDRFTPFERPLPYYSIIPEKKWQDERYLQLNRQEKGDFSLLVDALWQGCGSIRRDDVSQLAIDFEIPAVELRALVNKLLKVGLLVEKQGRLVQQELRNQYRYVCSANENMKREVNSSKRETSKRELCDENIPSPF